MQTLQELFLRRRSVRKYTETPVTEAQLTEILQAGLLAFSGRNYCPWEFILVQNPETLQALSRCRQGTSAAMLAEASAAIVVVASTERSDTWVEDCSIAMTYMHLTATDLGLGSCWIQGRNRVAADDTPTEAYVRKLVAFPESYRLESILSIGVPAEEKPAKTLEQLDYSKIHREIF